jgi:hypothetical protein
MGRFKTFGVRVVAVAALLQFAVAGNLHATTTVMSDLGTADATFFGLLALGTGGGNNFQWSGNTAEVIGNVGVSGSSGCSFSGSGTITGGLFESSATLCSTGNLNSNVDVKNFSQIATDASNAVTDFSNMAQNTTLTSAGGTGYNSGTNSITGNYTINAATSPTGAFTVIDLASISLTSGQTLTISGNLFSQVVINITGKLSNQSGDILLTGGIRPNDVVFNITGTGDALDIRGATHTSEGIFLSLNNTQQNNIQYQNIEGEVISGGNLKVVSPLITADAVPESGTWVLLASGFALIGLGTWRRRRNPQQPASPNR